MSDANRRDNLDDAEAIPPGAALLLKAALRAPEPPPGVESASQARVVRAYEASRLDPHSLRAESWTTDAANGLTGRLARMLRRLRGE
jgi:hypothetical protein